MGEKREDLTRDIYKVLMDKAIDEKYCEWKVVWMVWGRLVEAICKQL